MKILFVLNLRPDKSGITEQILYLRDKLEKESFKIELVSTFGGIYERMSGIFQTIGKAQSNDLIIGVGCSYFGFFPIFVAALAAFFLNKKIIYNYHGGQAELFFEKYNYFLKYIFKKDKIIVATEYLRKVFEKYNYKVTRINNFFNFESFPKAESEFKWNKKVVWCRSFEILYQPELALKVAEYLTKNNDFEFHFYGNGSLYKKLREKYENDKIIFYGLVERKKLLSDYQKYSFLFNTTLNDNIPNTIFEAGFYKLLVISSNVGGISTTFKDNEILFVNNNSEDSYINAFLEVEKNYNKYNDYREKLRRKVINFNWENVKNVWLAIINENRK